MLGVISLLADRHLLAAAMDGRDDALADRAVGQLEAHAVADRERRARLVGLALLGGLNLDGVHGRVRVKTHDA